MDAETLNRLRNTRSQKEWSAIAREVKAANNGEYPADWWDQVMLGGIAAHAEQNWEEEILRPVSDNEIKIGVPPGNWIKL